MKFYNLCIVQLCSSLHLYIFSCHSLLSKSKVIHLPLVCLCANVLFNYANFIFDNARAKANSHYTDRRPSTVHHFSDIPKPDKHRFNMLSENKRRPTPTYRGNTLIRQNLTNVSVAICLHLSVQCELVFEQEGCGKCNGSYICYPDKKIKKGQNQARQSIYISKKQSEINTLRTWSDFRGISCFISLVTMCTHTR